MLSVSPDVEFNNKLWEGCGRDLYEECAQGWVAVSLSALTRGNYTLTGVHAYSPGKLQCSWNVSFVPDTALTIYFLWSVLPGVTNVYYDVLSRETLESEFSWTALVEFIQRLVTKGECMVPHAVIMGTTNVDLEDLEEGGRGQATSHRRFELTRQRERLGLVRSYDGGYLKNRKLVTDLVKYMNATRPAHLGVEKHTDLVDGRVDTRRSRT